MRVLFFSVVFFLCAKSSFTQAYSYAIAKETWAEHLGNHRAVIEMPQYGDAVAVKINWRRRDKDAAEKAIIITDEDGNSVKNILRINVNRETAHIIFQPDKKAQKYYLYYYPWQGKAQTGSFSGTYLKREHAPEESWMSKNNLSASVFEKLPQAKVTEMQSRTAFDSFYPMEIVATAQETKNLLNAHNEPMLVFPEKRTNPIRMQDDLPAKRIFDGLQDFIYDTVYQNEYYAFQLGIYAAQQDLDNFQINYSGNLYPLTCFNAEGIDDKGNHFKKEIRVAKGKVQPLWFGVDVPRTAKPGITRFKVNIKSNAGREKSITVKLLVLPRPITNRGDDEPWRHSRLRWLNSTLGISQKVIDPYPPLKVSGQVITAGSGTIGLNQQGLPASVFIGGTELLNRPVSFNVISENKVPGLAPSSFTITKKQQGQVAWKSHSINENLLLTCNGSIEFDGYLKYTIIVKALKDVVLDDVSLNVPVNKNQAQYFMGMGLPGVECPSSYNWKWKGPQDSYWIGNAAAGMFCEMRGATYNGPLLNLYQPQPPPAWYNNNEGGFKIHSGKNVITAQTYSGLHRLKANDSLKFEFAFLITPVKKASTASQFTDRYYHNGNVPEPRMDEVTAGIKLINVHHANTVNPFINYPFLSVDSISAFASRWHKKDVKTKIYYTVRELTNQAPELWALRSLDNEILADGKGGGYMWLREHLGDHYNAQWFTSITGSGQYDAAILTSGRSRWYNYYVEGLKWIIQKTDIDGLYLDDVAFDRDLLKRMRRVMDMVKPGCMIDLHSNTGFSKGPATQYMEFFPYVNKLWFGESFHYNSMPPANWLVEVSGIPFGLMGDMLHAGGNPWRGMVYGMTVRYPWFTEGVTCDPREIWKVWDRFGIASARMNGYWERTRPVHTTDSLVLATSYLKQDSLLVSIASWNPNKTSVKLKVDLQKLGWKSVDTIVAPAINGFQPETRFQPDDAIPVDPEKGWLLILKRKE